MFHSMGAHSREKERLCNKKRDRAVNSDHHQSRFPLAEYGKWNEQPEKRIAPARDQSHPALPWTGVIELTTGETVKELSLHRLGQCKSDCHRGQHRGSIMAAGS